MKPSTILNLISPCRLQSSFAGLFSVVCLCLRTVLFALHSREPLPLPPARADATGVGCMVLNARGAVLGGRSSNDYRNHRPCQVLVLPRSAAHGIGHMPVPDLRTSNAYGYRLEHTFGPRSSARPPQELDAANERLHCELSPQRVGY